MGVNVERLRGAAEPAEFHLLDDAIEQLPAEQVLQHHVVVGGVFRVELVDLHHVRVVQLAEDLNLVAYTNPGEREENRFSYPK